MDGPPGSHVACGLAAQAEMLLGAEKYNVGQCGFDCVTDLARAIGVPLLSLTIPRLSFALRCHSQFAKVGGVYIQFSGKRAAQGPVCGNQGFKPFIDLAVHAFPTLLNRYHHEHPYTHAHQGKYCKPEQRGQYAALAGLAIAALGVYASHSLNRPELDGAASVAIGVLLAVVAIVLIYESRGLLIGEGINADTARSIRGIVLADASVDAAGYPLTMYLGPDEVLLTLDVEFAPGLSAGETTAAVLRLEGAIRSRCERIRRIYIESNPVEVEAQTRRIGMNSSVA